MFCYLLRGSEPKVFSSMSPLQDLLNNIEACTACPLMQENRDAGIPYVPIKPKPDAKVMFVGRDPSPQSVKIVGERRGRSVFINTIFKYADRSGLTESALYITDVCKCHWRTSVGSPMKGTEERATKLDIEVADVCMNTWLLQEIALLQPRLVVAFGEELYQLIRPFLTVPNPIPTKLSATRDKSVLDAEIWFADNGVLKARFGKYDCDLAVLRHPGNIVRLPKSNGEDKRRDYHQKAEITLIDLLKKR